MKTKKPMESKEDYTQKNPQHQEPQKTAGSCGTKDSKGQNQCGCTSSQEKKGQYGKEPFERGVDDREEEFGDKNEGRTKPANDERESSHRFEKPKR